MNYRSPEFLRDHIQRILAFYHPACIDSELGGYFNGFADDGTIVDHSTRHLVSTCRFIYNYATAWRLFGDAEYREAAAHGLRFLLEAHRQPAGDFAWVLDGRAVEDGTRHCYGHAFVLLAAASAAQAGIEGAPALIGEVHELLESHFWEPEAQLYAVEIAADSWDAVLPYRGQNDNMHMCEALIAAFEATGEARYLARARLLARRICVDLAAAADGLIWEHYTADWQHDWTYHRENPDHLFRPYGYLPGHFAEWAKLLLILDRHELDAEGAPGEHVADTSWHLPRAQQLFDVAVQKSWQPQGGGMIYTFAPDGSLLDRDRYYWVIAETLAASALLARKTGEARYWAWYDRLWQYADQQLIDHQHGGWFRVLDAQNQKQSDYKSPPAKTDYHPLAACYETLVALDAVSMD